MFFMDTDTEMYVLRYVVYIYCVRVFAILVKGECRRPRDRLFLRNLGEGHDQQWTSFGWCDDDFDNSSLFNNYTTIISTKLDLIWKVFTDQIFIYLIFTNFKFLIRYPLFYTTNINLDVIDPYNSINSTTDFYVCRDVVNIELDINASRHTKSTTLHNLRRKPWHYV